MEDLPLKPNEVELNGKFVRVCTMNLEEDIGKLFEFSCGKSFTYKEKLYEDYDSLNLIWKYMLWGPFQSAEEMKLRYQRFVNLPDARVFTLFDQSTNLPIGSTAFQANSPADLRVELGATWLSPAVQRSGICTEAIYLLTNYAVEIGYRRIETKGCTDNIKTVNLAEKIGFKFELNAEEWSAAHGVFSGCSYFAMFRDEWINSYREKMRTIIYKD